MIGYTNVWYGSC